MWSVDELIVAPATVRGAGARAVVRLSGAGLEGVLAQVFVPVAGGFAKPGERPRLVVAKLSFEGLAGTWGAVPVDVLHWPGPEGPTGGPLAEVQLPASAPLSDAVIAEICRLGARLARGGEFSLRAFLAGRLDLLQAEAVLAVVDARTPPELSAALDRMAGGIGRSLHALGETLLDLAADIEATIDFADEHTPDAVPVADANAWRAIDDRLANAMQTLEILADRLAGRDAGAEGDLPRVVLAGSSNIGKSSLFNALLGRPAALVADEAGTTRDWIAARLDPDPLAGWQAEPAPRVTGSPPAVPACLLVDIAGVDAEEPGAEVAPLVRAAFERAREEIARADVVVVCRDAAASTQASVPPLPPTAVRIDATTRCDLVALLRLPAAAYRTSSRCGTGVSELRAAILSIVAELPSRRSPATLRMQVGVAAARQAVAAAQAAARPAGGGGSRDEAIVASLLRQAVAAVGEVTGAEIGTALIDRIFSRHCIGK
ncbi:MAG: 50S ribosome-binding GTPase [Planctomycetes bacterium]|nr:50S ribosome-binding GTPase [Planctomycetota bacterium]